MKESKQGRIDRINRSNVEGLKMVYGGKSKTSGAGKTANSTSSGKKSGRK